MKSGDDLLALLVEHLRAHGHLDHEVLGALAGAITAHAVFAATRLEVLGIAKVDQRVEPGHRLEHHVAALAAIAAIGTAELDVLLASETHRPGTAGARADEDLGLVEKVHFGFASITGIRPRALRFAR